MLINRDASASLIFKSIKDLIIGVGKSHYFWGNSEFDNKYDFALECSEIIKISIHFKNEFALDNFVFTFNDSEGQSVKPVVVGKHGCSIIFEFGNFESIKYISVKNNLGDWGSIKLFHMKVEIETNSGIKTLYDSEAFYFSVVNLINESLALGISKEEHQYLIKLNESVFFKADWTKVTDKNNELFDEVCNVINPYTVGAHGYTYPLISQGIDTRASGLKTIISILDTITNDWFATSGTLLGFVRDQSFIPYDDDLDFVICLGQCNDETELFKKIHELEKEHGNKLIKTNNPLHFRLAGNVGAVDVFLSWFNSNEQVCVYPWCFKSLNVKDLFPLRSLEVYDVQVKVPSNYKAALTLNYGQDWIVPDPLWRFDWDNSNVLFKNYLTFKEV